ncbi:MAG TPA: hypothetical protein VGD29_01675 [Actinoplanes sp.]|jgi:hypothetical protein
MDDVNVFLDELELDVEPPEQPGTGALAEALRGTGALRPEYEQAVASAIARALADAAE